MKYQEIIKQLFEKYFVKLYRFFYARTLSKEIAEDLTSDTFTSISEKAKNDKDILTVSDYERYLLGIAKHKFSDYLRKKYQLKEVSLDELESVASFAQNFSPTGNHLEQKIHNLIQLLPSKQKEILRLRLIEKKTLTEICELTRKDMNYVRTTQKRGIKRLKELVANCTQVTT